MIFIAKIATATATPYFSFTTGFSPSFLLVLLVSLTSTTGFSPSFLLVLLVLPGFLLVLLQDFSGRSLTYTDIPTSIRNLDEIGGRQVGG